MNFTSMISFSFSNFRNNFKLHLNYILVSFDVFSLFTNLTFSVILNGIEKNWSNKQILLTAMGSKMLPILVTYVLDRLNQIILTS